MDARALRPLPLTYVGHSFGGQALGLLRNNTEISRALFIAAQAGYWKLMASPERYRVYAMLNFVGVPLTKMFGYMPGWAGLGEDLPKDAFLQWVGWVMKERYLFDDPRSTPARISTTTRARCVRCVFTTIPGRPQRGRAVVLGLYRDQARHLRSRLEVGVKKIGHFGFFRPEHRDTLWRGAAEWLQVDQ